MYKAIKRGLGTYFYVRKHGFSRKEALSELCYSMYVDLKPKQKA